MPKNAAAAADATNQAEEKKVTTGDDNANLRKAAGAAVADKTLPVESSGSTTHELLMDASGKEVLPKPGNVNTSARQFENDATSGGPVRVRPSTMDIDGKPVAGKSYTREGQEVFVATEGDQRRKYTVTRNDDGAPTLEPYRKVQRNEVETPGRRNGNGNGNDGEGRQVNDGRPTNDGRLNNRPEVKPEVNTEVRPGRIRGDQTVANPDVRPATIRGDQTVTNPDVKPGTVRGDQPVVNDNGRLPRNQVTMEIDGKPVNGRLTNANGQEMFFTREGDQPRRYSVNRNDDGQPVLEPMKAREGRGRFDRDSDGQPVKPENRLPPTNEVRTDIKPSEVKPIEPRIEVKLPAVEVEPGQVAVEVLKPGQVIQPGIQPGAQVPVPRTDLPGVGIAKGDQPGLPRVDQPGFPRGDQPKGDLPGMPRVEQPGIPKGDLPGMPRVEQPGIPKGDLPGIPRVEQPGIPKGDLPGIPKVEQPGIPKGDLPGMPKVDVAVIKPGDGAQVGGKAADMAAQLAALVKPADQAAITGKATLDQLGQPLKPLDPLNLKPGDLVTTPGVKPVDLALATKPLDAGIKVEVNAVGKLGEDLRGIDKSILQTPLGGKVGADGLAIKDVNTKSIVSDVHVLPTQTNQAVLSEMAKALGITLDSKTTDGKAINPVDAKLTEATLKTAADVAKAPAAEVGKMSVELGAKGEIRLEGKRIDTVRTDTLTPQKQITLNELLPGMKDARPDGLISKTDVPGKLDTIRPENQTQKVDAATGLVPGLPGSRVEAERGARNEQVQINTDKIDPSTLIKTDKENGKIENDTTSSAAKFDELIDKAKKQRDEDRTDQEELLNQRSAMMMALLAQKKQQQEQEEKEFQLRNEDAKKKGEDKRRRYVVKEKETLESIAKKQCRDVRLAALLYEINKHMLPVRMEKGKQVVDPRPGTAIWLPSDSDIKEFRSRLYAAPKPGASLSGGATKFASADDELASKFGADWDGTKPSVADGLMGSAVAKSQNRRENIEKILGPMAGKAGDSSRIRYIVRLTDSIESVAAKHPALKDAELWPLLASLNGLSTEVDESDKPVAELRRGMVLDIPLPAEIEQFRTGEFEEDEAPAPDDVDASEDLEEIVESTVGAEEIDWEATIQAPALPQPAKPMVQGPQSHSVSQTQLPVTAKPSLPQPFVVPANSAQNSVAQPIAPLRSSAPAQPIPPIQPVASAPSPVPIVPVKAEGPPTISPYEAAQAAGQQMKMSASETAHSLPVSPAPGQANLSGNATQTGGQAVSKPAFPFKPGATVPAVPVTAGEPARNSTPSPTPTSASNPTPPSASVPVQAPAPVPFQAPPAMSSPPALSTSMQMQGRPQPTPPPVAPGTTFSSVLPARTHQQLNAQSQSQSQQSQSYSQPMQAQGQIHSAPAAPAPVQSASQTETNPVLNAVPSAGQSFNILDQPPIDAGDRFIWQLDASVRLVKSSIKWDPAIGVFRSQLELLLNEVWYPVIFYEVYPNMAVRHEYVGGGRKKSVKMDLPPIPAQELADNDLINNWQRYCHTFVSQFNGPTSQTLSSED